jgi:hypothetical protein
LIWINSRGDPPCGMLSCCTECGSSSFACNLCPGANPAAADMIQDVIAQNPIDLGLAVTIADRVVAEIIQHVCIQVDRHGLGSGVAQPTFARASTRTPHSRALRSLLREDRSPIFAPCQLDPSLLQAVCVCLGPFPILRPVTLEVAGRPVRGECAGWSVLRVRRECGADQEQDQKIGPVVTRDMLAGPRGHPRGSGHATRMRPRCAGIGLRCQRDMLGAARHCCYASASCPDGTSL